MMQTESRERTRRAVRDEVVNHAWELFARQGFAGTTVDEIAAASGMSRRSFFRYFASKENLLLEQLIENAKAVAEELARRPEDEPVWQALRNAFAPLVATHEEHADYTVPLIAMLREPDLRATLQERRVRMEGLLTPIVAERIGDGPDQEIRAAAIAGAAVGCFIIAQQRWGDDPSTSFRELLDSAMGAIRPT